MKTRLADWFRLFRPKSAGSSLSGRIAASAGALALRFGLLVAGIGLAETAAAAGESSEPIRVFGGRSNWVSAVLTNPLPQPVSIDLRVRLHQIGGPLAAPFDEKSVGLRQRPSRSRTIESVAVPFPEVRAATPFLLQWFDGTNRVLNVTRLKAYPSGLLRELSDLSGAEPLFLEDASDMIRSALAQAGVRTLPQEPSASAMLAIVVDGIDGKGHETVKTKLQAGAGVVWIPRRTEPEDELAPLLYVIPGRSRALVVLHPDALEDFANNPTAQLTLVQACRLALKPVVPGFPDLAADLPAAPRHEP